MFKDKVCIIAPHMKGEQYFEGQQKLGNRIITPYRDYNLGLRCMRELWFRMKLPMRNLWYNPKCKTEEAELYVLSDALLTIDFLKFLRAAHPDSRIAIVYQNPVGISMRYQNPTEGSSGLSGLKDLGIELWSYDKADCERYGMSFSGVYFQDGWTVDKKYPPDFDVVYVGRDKGRATQLFEIEESFRQLGLKTYFHICADRRYLLFTKRYYKPLLSYSKYIELLGRTKGILNIVNDGCDSITMRELEAIFYEIKCITNNPSIESFIHYHPSRYFVLGKDDIADLPEFISSPYVPVAKEELEKMCGEHGLERIYSAGKI